MKSMLTALLGVAPAVDLTKVTCQTYNGAANMQGRLSSVQFQNRQDYALSIHVGNQHSTGHSIIADTCET